MKDYEEKVINIMDSAKDNIRTQLDKAYKSGYEDAKSELGKKVINLAHEESDCAYHQGLEDAWKITSKIMQIPIQERSKLFGVSPNNACFVDISSKYSVSEAIEKWKAWKEKQDEIKVGDEVYSDAFDDKGIITHITTDKVSCVCIICNGWTMMRVGTNGLHKTGRTFPQIAEVLREMRGESE